MASKCLIYKTSSTEHHPVLDPNEPKVMEFNNDAEATEYATVDGARGDRDYAIVDLAALTWNQAPAYEEGLRSAEGTGKGKKKPSDEEEEA